MKMPENARENSKNSQKLNGRPYFRSEAILYLKNILERISAEFAVKKKFHAIASKALPTKDLQVYITLL